MPMIEADGEVIQQVRRDYVIIVEAVIFRQRFRRKATAGESFELVNARCRWAQEMAKQIAGAMLFTKHIVTFNGGQN